MTSEELFRLSSVSFRISEDKQRWLASDGVRCIVASTITECVERAARVVNWGTGEFPREEAKSS